jgi:hypothetical protein
MAHAYGRDMWGITYTVSHNVIINISSDTKTVLISVSGSSIAPPILVALKDWMKVSLAFLPFLTLVVLGNLEM